MKATLIIERDDGRVDVFMSPMFSLDTGERVMTPGDRFFQIDVGARLENCALLKTDSLASAFQVMAGN